MSDPRRIVREQTTARGEFVRTVLVHGGDDTGAVCIVASDGGDGGNGPLWLDLDQAAALVHMLADALTIARLGGGT